MFHEHECFQKNQRVSLTRVSGGRQLDEGLTANRVLPPETRAGSAGRGGQESSGATEEEGG